SRTADVYRALPGGVGQAAAARPAVDGWPGWWLRALQPATLQTRWLVRVIAGKSMWTVGPSKCFGFVQTYDRKPKRAELGRRLGCRAIFRLLSVFVRLYAVLSQVLRATLRTAQEYGRQRKRRYTMRFQNRLLIGSAS